MLPAGRGVVRPDRSLGFTVITGRRATAALAGRLPDGRCAVMWNGLWRTVQRAIEAPELTVRLIAILITIGTLAAVCGWSWRA